VYQFFAKHREQHEKKFPPKGEALSKRWDEFKKAETLAREKAKEAKPVEEVKDAAP
jgi:hypothetical protein